MFSSWYNKSRKMSVKSLIVCPIQLLLNCSVYIRILTVLVCSSLTIRKLERIKFIKPEVISVLGTIGPTMCTNKCKSLYGCNGVKYDRQQLTCELLRMHPTTDDISEKTGSMFADLSSLPLINAAGCWPNPCSQNYKCIVSRQHETFCISNVVKLIFMETITSTNYPEAYPNYNSQNWTLVVGNNSRLVLRLKAFKLETSSDVLKVFDRQGGQQLYSLTGSYLPDDIWLNSNAYHSTFTSDLSITYSGFAIDVYETERL